MGSIKYKGRVTDGGKLGWMKGYRMTNGRYMEKWRHVG